MNLWRNEDWRRRITLREIELMKDTATRDHASICVTHVFWRAFPPFGLTGGRRYFFSSAGLPAEAESLVISASCFWASSISEGWVAT